MSVGRQKAEMLKSGILSANEEGISNVLARLLSFFRLSSDVVGRG